MNRLIRKVINEWVAWRSRAALYRAHPELRHIDTAMKEARRRHSSVAHLQAAKKAVILSALAASNRTVEG